MLLKDVPSKELVIISVEGRVPASLNGYGRTSVLGQYLFHHASQDASLFIPLFWFTNFSPRFVVANICRDFLLVSAGTSEYTLTKEDVGRCLAFAYIPINFEGWYLEIWCGHDQCILSTASSHLYVTSSLLYLSGQEGKSLSVMSPVVKQGISMTIYTVSCTLFLLFSASLSLYIVLVVASAILL